MPDPDLVTLEDWVAREAVPFSLSPDGGDTLDAAADRLVAACDPALEILGLGEPTHLVNDYLRLRNRLFQTLVSRHGFRAIAIESSFTRAAVADDFVAGRGGALDHAGSLDDALGRGITHDMGRMPANRELLEWMRRHNAGVPDADRLRFYGFDSPTEMMYADSPRQLLATALDYLATLNPASGQSRREQIEPLIGDDADWENPAAMMDPAKSVGRSPAADALRLATEDLIAELAALQPQGVAAGPAAYRRAVRHAVHARQMLTYHAAVARPSPDRTADLLGLRDVMMADNLRYVADQERGRGERSCAGCWRSPTTAT
jgi:erythromycin esterase